MLRKKLSLLLALLLLFLSVVSCSPEEEEIPEYMRAHIAENTTPLETDKFLDYPDFILYTKGDKTIKLSHELQAQVYAEFEAYMAGVDSYNPHVIMSLTDLAEHVSNMKNSGAIRFCYQQRRYYTGMFIKRGTDSSDYRWGNLMFDEVMMTQWDILFAINGKYKSVNHKGDKIEEFSLHSETTRDHLSNMFSLIESSS